MANNNFTLRKTRDTDVSNTTTLVFDDELKFFLESRRRFKFRLVLFYQVRTVDTSGINLHILTPPLLESAAAVYQYFNENGGDLIDPVVQYGVQFDLIEKVIIQGRHALIVDGDVANGDLEGYFTVCYAQSVADPLALTILKGSSLELTEQN